MLRSTEKERAGNSNAKNNSQRSRQTTTRANQYFVHTDGLGYGQPSSFKLNANIVNKRIGFTHALMVTRRTIFGHTLPLAGRTKQWITPKIKRHGYKLQTS